MKTYLILATVIFLALSLNVQARPLTLQNYQADYVIKYDGIPIGKSTTSFKLAQNHHYWLCIDNITTVPFLQGRMEECSVGFLQYQQVKPLSYAYFYQRNKTQQVILIHFDWQKKACDDTN